MGSIAIGLSLVITGCLFNALGFNLQELAQNPNVGHGKKRDFKYFKYLNTVGVVLTASSGIFDVLSFSFAPQSILAPAGISTLLFNLILAPVLLKKKVTPNDAIATALICAGIFICLLFGSSDPVSYSPRKLAQLASRPAFILFVMAYAGALAGLAAHITTGEKRGRGKAIDVAISYPFLASLLSGILKFMAKLLTELLPRVSLRTSFPLIVGIVVVLAGAAVGQMSVMNQALSKHSSLMVIPVFSAAFLTVNLAIGGVFFQEFATFGALKMLGFCAGVLTVWLGVTVVALRPEQPEKEKNDAEQEEEEHDEKLRGSASKRRSRKSKKSGSDSIEEMVNQARESIETMVADGEQVLHDLTAKAQQVFEQPKYKQK